MWVIWTGSHCTEERCFKNNVYLSILLFVVGKEYVTEMFAFMCFSSCASGPAEDQWKLFLLWRRMERLLVDELLR